MDWSGKEQKCMCICIVNSIDQFDGECLRIQTESNIKVQGMKNE